MTISRYWIPKTTFIYDGYRAAKKEYDDLLKEEASASQQQDFFRFEHEYISGLGLRSGEDEELRERLNMMKNSAKIFQAVRSSYDALSGSEYGSGTSVLEVLGNVTSELSGISAYSDQIAEMSNQASDAYYALDDIASRLRDMAASLDFSESDMDAVSERLALIEDAKRKYKKDIDGIIGYKEELESKLGMIENFDHEKARLKENADRKYDALKDQAEYVSELRHVIASRLESAMERELKDLEFANSEFRIDISKLDEIGPLGFDRVEFLVSTNPGEPLMPLTKIASGGEISRIMLAFKHIIGESDSVETMIFDEIDTGISGHTALVVGNKLSEIADHRQILSITHLPQIAACADDNFLISKSVESDKSYTDIEHLDEDGKVRMIATLFSGSSDSGNALEAARELIAGCRKEARP